MHCYRIRIAAKELPTVYGDDRYARKVCARWIRLFWERYKVWIHEKHPGSMSDAEAHGWYEQPTVEIQRSAALDSAFIIPAKPWTRLEHFEIHPTTLDEFFRIAK